MPPPLTRRFPGRLDPDDLCVPSARVSFGLSLCEGLWAGVPVIPTRAGVCKLVDGLTLEIPVGADGDVAAAAVPADPADPEGARKRVEYARVWARAAVAPERFGREWAKHLLGTAASRPGP